MNFRVENLWMLFGLFALAVPIVLHLLRRSRYEVLDWGAMQFLPDSITAHRKRWLDEILLMLLRMAMIALIVIALATPVSTSAWLAPLADRQSREVLIVVDGSYSMDVRAPAQSTPWQEATRWVRDYLDEPSNAHHSILVARQPPQFMSADSLPGTTPRGNPDMPGALASAWQHLQRSKATAKEIVVVTDGQRHGWADHATLSALDTLGMQWHSDADHARADGLAVPSLRVIKVGASLPNSLPNFALGPLAASRGVVKVGKTVSFESMLHADGFRKPANPRNVKWFVGDGRTKSLGTEVPLPERTELTQQTPIRFQHRFAKEGQYIVSLIVDAEDALAADNEQHVVVEVVKELPILLVDGDAQVSGESSSFFLQRALGAKAAIPSTALKAETIASTKPAVIVLADVATLDSAQIEAIDGFLMDGGGLLIAAGARVAGAKTFYNDQLYRKGDGWLPARLGEIGSAKDGMQPDPRTFLHPALELFRAKPDGSMNQVRFPKWWKIALDSRDRAVSIGMLANGDPFLLERPFKQGRVILCTTPLDRRWDSTLPSAVEFPILVNELVGYLAGSRNVATTLRNGAPIRLADVKPGSRLTVRAPDAPPATMDAKQTPWVFDNTRAVGVYQVQANERTWSYVVQPDARESDLTRCTDDDWRKVRDRLAVVWKDGPTESTTTDANDDARREELWWLLFLVVVGLLCSEVWMTRRMALARGQ